MSHQRMSTASTRVLTPGRPAIAPAPQESVSSEPRAARLRSVISRSVRRVCTNVFGSRLKSIILTGSLARDEATFARIANLETVFGDAEFMLVLQRHEAFPDAALLGVIRQRIERDLLQRQIICKIDLSVVRPDYFQRLPPHIFSFELKHCGRVIWGGDDGLRAIPDYSAGALSREDAARLLSNRLVELLEYAPEIFNSQISVSPAFQYKLLKLYLDMGTSLLVFLGNYAPTYRERQQLLFRLASRAPETKNLPFDMKAFAACLAVCTQWKLSPRASLEVAPHLQWREAIRAARTLWRWELIQLTGASHAIADAELFQAWNRMQSQIANLRGWMRVACLCGWRVSSRHWPKWWKLCLTTGPRFGVYRAAVGLLFGASSGPNGSGSHNKAGTNSFALRHFLPLADGAQEQNGPDNELMLAAATISNYREFLVGTRL